AGTRAEAPRRPALAPRRPGAGSRTPQQPRDRRGPGPCRDSSAAGPPRRPPGAISDGRTRRSSKPSSDRGDDADFLVALQGRVEAVEEADVLLADIDVHEASHSLVVEEPILDPRVVALEVVDEGAHVGPAGLNTLFTAGEAAQGRGNADSCHYLSPTWLNSRVVSGGQWIGGSGVVPQAPRHRDAPCPATGTGAQHSALRGFRAGWGARRTGDSCAARGSARRAVGRSSRRRCASARSDLHAPARDRAPARP